MNIRTILSSVALFSCFDMGCAYYLDRGTSISNGIWIGETLPVKGLYDEPPSVDGEGFPPSGGAMTQKTWNPRVAELDFSAEFRLLIPDYVYFGLNSTLFSLHNNGNSSCLFINCRQVRVTTVYWWDEVVAEDVTLTRSPSIGALVGYRSDEGKAGKVIQYSFSGRYYRLGRGTFSGVDCRGCKNSSVVKSTETITDGAALRHTIEIGFEPVRFSFWFESISSKAWASGAGVTIVAPILEDAMDDGRSKRR